MILYSTFLYNIVDFQPQCSFMKGPPCNVAAPQGLLIAMKKNSVAAATLFVSV